MKCERIIFRRNEEKLQFKGKIFETNTYNVERGRAVTITLELTTIPFM
jgi:hypothetical protein